MTATTQHADNTPETGGDETAEPSQSKMSRAVLWAGVALGTFLTVVAMTDGARLRLGAMPAWLGVVTGTVIIWALIVAAAITATELTRRHHRTAGRYALAQGRRGALAGGRAAHRGAVAGGRAAHRGGQTARTHAATWATSRWQARQLTKPRSDPAADPPPAPPDAPAADGTPTPSPAGASDRPEGTMPMPAKPTSRITPDRRARRAATALGGGVPDAWGPVVAQAADFEPESDAHMLGWMAGQVTGMAAYAEALIEAYETGVGAVGIDPKGLAALHDVADAAAHAAETMSGARTKFADHYELPREFAANGGLMTHDGRWVTGDGD